MDTNNEDIIKRLDELLDGQSELTLLLKGCVASGFGVVSPPAEEWLTKDAVMDLLCITESTFYRRLSECAWVRKRNGRGWYYLKSSVI